MTWSIAMSFPEGRSAGSQEGFGNHGPLGSWDTPSPRRVKSHRVCDTPIGDARNTNKTGEREPKSHFHSINSSSLRCYETLRRRPRLVHCHFIRSPTKTLRKQWNAVHLFLGMHPSAVILIFLCRKVPFPNLFPASLSFS